MTLKITQSQILMTYKNQNHERPSKTTYNFWITIAFKIIFKSPSNPWITFKAMNDRQNKKNTIKRTNDLQNPRPFPLVFDPPGRRDCGHAHAVTNEENDIPCQVDIRASGGIQCTPKFRPPYIQPVLSG